MFQPWSNSIGSQGYAQRDMESNMRNVAETARMPAISSNAYSKLIPADGELANIQLVDLVDLFGRLTVLRRKQRDTADMILEPAISADVDLVRERARLLQERIETADESNKQALEEPEGKLLVIGVLAEAILEHNSNRQRGLRRM